MVPLPGLLCAVVTVFFAEYCFRLPYSCPVPELDTDVGSLVDIIDDTEANGCVMAGITEDG